MEEYLKSSDLSSLKKGFFVFEMAKDKAATIQSNESTMEETVEITSVKLEDHAKMFQDFEVKDIYGFKNGDNFIDVICGCTSYMYGDTVGKLRVHESGELEIECECNPACHEVLKPTEFEKHSLKETPGKWRNNIWVTIGCNKVPLAKTVLLRYSDGNIKARPSKRKLHRDEFVKCAKCSKRRRFVVSTEKQYRKFHDAQIDGNWECSHHPYGMITCADKEERESKRRARGCLQHSVCSGCTKCVCFGCKMCRFSDCNCQICIDFINNSDI